MVSATDISSHYLHRLRNARLPPLCRREGVWVQASAGTFRAWRSGTL